jgi:hypothetical protein
MTTQPDPANLWPVLTSALQLLAADPDEQVAALPDFVHVPDELTLNFDDAMVLAPRLRRAGLLDDGATERLQELQSALQAIDRWDLDALREDPAWSNVRERARDVLAHLGLPRGPIDLSSGQYVRGKPDG